MIKIWWFFEASTRFVSILCLAVRPLGRFVWFVPTSGRVSCSFSIPVPSNLSLSLSLSAVLTFSSLTAGNSTFSMWTAAEFFRVFSHPFSVHVFFCLTAGVNAAASALSADSVLLSNCNSKRPSPLFAWSNFFFSEVYLKNLYPAPVPAPSVCVGRRWLRARQVVSESRVSELLSNRWMSFEAPQPPLAFSHSTSVPFRFSIFFIFADCALFRLIDFVKVTVKIGK